MAIENDSLNLEAGSLVSQVIGTWRSGGVPNALDVIEQHPYLRHFDSLILDLAYEEYCLRRESGEQVVLSTYCDQFPTVEKSLRKLLAAHECIEEDADDEDARADTPWPETESLFLGFYLVREIGRGSFARVFLATEPSLGDRLVVVKIARGGGGEAETLGRLKHRNIVPVYSVQEDEATQLTAICMPYLGRGTLLKTLHLAYRADNETPRASLFLQTGQQDSILDAIPETYTESDPRLEKTSFVDGAVHVVAQLADALAHAHDAGICHRDLKPSNVLLAPSGHPLLLDFNLSTDERLQRTLVGGTLPYMPPEQLRSVLVDDDASSPGDPRGDVFSLGVILYELLTGKLPFGDQVSSETVEVAAFRIMAHQVEGCEPLTTFRPDIDPKLVQVVTRCLQLEPEHRYQRACDLVVDLRARLTHKARLKRWTHRRRFLLSTAAAGLGLAAAAAGFGIAMRPPYAQRRYLAGIRAFENGELEKAVDYFTDAHEDRPDAYQPLFARAQAQVGLGIYDKAAEDLENAYLAEPNGPVAEWAGYAFLLCDREIPATYYYPEAIKHGYETVGVRNNFAYALRNKQPLFPNAAEQLNRAIELDRKCQVAYINRAYVYARYPIPISPDGTPYRALAIRDAEYATTLGPHRPLAYCRLAMIYRMHDQTSEKDQKILTNLRLAIDHGYDRNKVLHDSGLEEYSELLEDYGRDVTPVPIQPLLIAPSNLFPPMDPQ